MIIEGVQQPGGASRIDLIIHPVRIRIIRALESGEKTAAEIRRLLPDIPQATMYRHLNKLCAGEMLQISSERRIRGALERTYVLRPNAEFLESEDMQNAGPDAYARLIGFFAASLMSDCNRYLSSPESQPAQEGIYLRQALLYLNPKELQNLAGDLEKLIRRYAKRRPAPGRKLRILSAAVIPEVQEGPHEI